MDKLLHAVKEMGFAGVQNLPNPNPNPNPDPNPNPNPNHNPNPNQDDELALEALKRCPRSIASP